MLLSRVSEICKGTFLPEKRPAIRLSAQILRGLYYTVVLHNRLVHLVPYRHQSCTNGVVTG